MINYQSSRAEYADNAEVDRVYCARIGCTRGYSNSGSAVHVAEEAQE